MLKRKIGTSVLLGALLVVGMTACNEGTESKKAPKTLNTLEDKAGYAIGLQVGKQVVKTKDLINKEALLLGMNDALDGSASKLSEEEIQKAMQEFSVKAQAAAMEEMKKAFEANKKEGEAFLAANKAKEGVVTLPSGLQYKIITKGTGKTPKATDTVETNYKGMLINGTEFDSSYKRGQSATFPVNGVIAGWTEALQLMKEGGKWELYIPSELAYGEKGAGQVIQPNSVLVFEIELLKVKDAAKK